MEIIAPESAAETVEMVAPTIVRALAAAGARMAAKVLALENAKISVTASVVTTVLEDAVITAGRTAQMVAVGTVGMAAPPIAAQIALNHAVLGVLRLVTEDVKVPPNPLVVGVVKAGVAETVVLDAGVVVPLRARGSVSMAVGMDVRPEPGKGQIAGRGPAEVSIPAGDIILPPGRLSTLLLRSGIHSATGSISSGYTKVICRGRGSSM